MLCEQTEEFEASEMASFFTAETSAVSQREKGLDQPTTQVDNFCSCEWVKEL